MEDPGIPYKTQVYILLLKEHIGTRITVEGKIPVAVLKGFNKGKRCPCLLIDDKTPGIYPHFIKHVLKLMAEYVISYLTDKSDFMSQLLKHREDIAGRTSGIGLIKGIALA